jgi:hypothetical protein
MKRSFVIFLLMSVCAVASATDLAMGVVRLSLGMEKEAVLKALGQHYTVKSQPNLGEMHSIFKENKPPFTSIGYVSFREGKLTWASRQWADSKTVTASDYASTLFAAVESATLKSGSTATVRTTITRNPEMEIKQIEFVFSDRKISTLISDDRTHGKSVGIQEIISANKL